jgi:hypothetical protein
VDIQGKSTNSRMTATPLSCLHSRRQRQQCFILLAGIAIIIICSTTSSAPTPWRQPTLSRPSGGAPVPPSDAWAELRPNSCDGFPLPPEASIGEYRGRCAYACMTRPQVYVAYACEHSSRRRVPLLRTLVNRQVLPTLANELNLTGAAVELGVFRGEFSEQNLKAWRGKVSDRYLARRPLLTTAGRQSVFAPSSISTTAPCRCTLWWTCGHQPTVSEAMCQFASTRMSLGRTTR